MKNNLIHLSKCSALLSPPLAKGGRGSTLTEVLVALMITSIGLVSVATLFPLSILRSVKATQFTTATDARYNAEAAIDMYPNIIANPINPNFPPGLLTSTGSDPAVLPIFNQALPTQNYIIDPLGFAAVFGLNLTIGGSNVAWQTRPEHWFGNDINGGTAPPSTSIPFVDTNNGLWGIGRYPLTWRPRVAGGPGVPANVQVPDLVAADFLVTLPDSWPLQYDTVGGLLGTDKNAPGTQVTQITLAGVPLGQIQLNFPSPAMRVVMFSTDGQTSQIRNITSIQPASNGQTTAFVWTEDIDGAGPNATTAAGGDQRDINHNSNLDHYPLPASFVNSGVGIVRIELQERRYTWLLTVRQSYPQTTPPSASVDVVVFFKRTIENIGVDEALYPAVFTQGSTQVAVQYPTGNNTVTGQPLKPFMKRGGYVFDANNAYWYRISNVIEPDPLNLNPPAGSASARVILDFPAAANNGFVPNIPSRAMFPRGVVDVFPLGTRFAPLKEVKVSL